MPHIYEVVPVDFCGIKLLEKIIGLVTSKRPQKNPRDKVCKYMNLHTYDILISPTKVLTGPRKSPRLWGGHFPVKSTRSPIRKGQFCGDSGGSERRMGIAMLPASSPEILLRG
jgi:hypothetical protein